MRTSSTPCVTDGINHGGIDDDGGFEQERVQDEFVLFGIPFDRHFCKDSILELIELIKVLSTWVRAIRGGSLLVRVVVKERFCGEEVR